MLWRLLLFRLGRRRRLLLRLVVVLACLAAAALLLTMADRHRQYTLTVEVQPPFVGEGVEIFAGCCRIVAELSGDRRTFVFVLPHGDYNVGGMLAQNGEFQPLPSAKVPVHLNHDLTVTLHGNR